MILVFSLPSCFGKPIMGLKQLSPFCFNAFKLCFWGFQIQNSLYFNLSFHLFWSIFDRDCDWITFVDLSCQFLLSFVIKSVWNAGFLVRSRYYKFVTATLLLLRIIRRIKNDEIVGIRKYHEVELKQISYE